MREYHEVRNPTVFMSKSNLRNEKESSKK